MSDFKRGDRVRLMHTTDPHTTLQRGTVGTVQSIDSLGTIHVKWDSGHTLGVCLDAGDDLDLVV